MNNIDYAIIERGRKAKIVHDIPEFHFLIDEINKDLFNRFNNVSLGNNEDTQKILATSKALTLIVRQIENYIAFGNQESAKLTDGNIS